MSKYLKIIGWIELIVVIICFFIIIDIKPDGWLGIIIVLAYAFFAPAFGLLLISVSRLLENENKINYLAGRVKNLEKEKFVTAKNNNEPITSNEEIIQNKKEQEPKHEGFYERKLHSLKSDYMYFDDESGINISLIRKCYSQGSFVIFNFCGSDYMVECESAERAVEVDTYIKSIIKK